jgi:flagellar biosynthesis protein FliR
MDGIVSLSIPYFYLLHILVVAVRVGGALLFAPIWGYSGFPQQFRVVLVFSFAVLIASVVPISQHAYDNPALVFPTEFIIGLLLSMGIRIAFAGLQLGAQLISMHVGLSMVQTIDPTTQNRSTLMSGFLSMLGYLMILTTNQHYSMISTLAKSYTVFPIGTIVQSGQWFDTLMKAAGQIFVIGWKIALPVFIATLMLELTVAFIARMHPQISSMVVTAPLKIYIGFLVLGASLAFFPRAIGDAFNMVVLRK